MDKLYCDTVSQRTIPYGGPLWLVLEYRLEDRSESVLGKSKTSKCIRVLVVVVVVERQPPLDTSDMLSLLTWLLTSLKY